MNIEISILGKDDLPFGHLYKTHCDFMQRNAMQWAPEPPGPCTSVNLNFSPAASDILIIKLLNKYVLKMLWLYSWSVDHK